MEREFCKPIKVTSEAYVEVGMEKAFFELIQSQDMLRKAFRGHEHRLVPTDGYVIQMVEELKEECIKEVLRQILQREPTIEDAKQCSMLIRYDVIDKFELMFQNVILGVVSIVYNYPNLVVGYKQPIQVIFEPDQTFRN